jgi:hypothetical protein
MSDTDPTAPWFEFISYIRCCESLNIEPRVSKFMAYNRYYHSIYDKNGNRKSI